MARFKLRSYTNAISFDGTTSFLAKSTPVGINTGTTSRTAMGWVFLRDTSVLNTFVQFKVNSAQSVGFLLGSLAGTYYYAFDTINAGNNKTISAAEFKSNFPVGKWLHVAFIATTSTVSLYVNGTVVVNASSWGTAINTGTYNNLFVGKTQDRTQTNLYFHRGLMKDIVIANAALTATEIQQHYNHKILPTSMISNYLMEEGSGTNVADIKETNSLTATGITWSTTNLPLKFRPLSTSRVLGTGRVLATNRVLA